jgi:hypothetical protein
MIYIFLFRPFAPGTPSVSWRRSGCRFSPRSGVPGNILHFPVAPHPRHIQRDPGATPSAWAHASQLPAPSLGKLCDAAAARFAVGSSTGRRPPRGRAPLRPHALLVERRTAGSSTGRRPSWGEAPLRPPSPRPPTLGPPPPPSAARLAVAPQRRSSSRTRSGAGHLHARRRRGRIPLLRASELGRRAARVGP